MFQKLLGRGKSHSVGADPFSSTTFSLSTQVPRPSERRAEERVAAMLRLAKLINAAEEEQLIRVHNISVGGMMAETTQSLAVGEAIQIELSAVKIPATVVWLREEMAGFKFDQNIDLGELLAGRKERASFRQRPPRLNVECKANVKVDKTYYTVDVHDISLGGVKVEPIAEYCLGKQVVVVVESLRPIKGEVRWYSDKMAGIVFDKPLSFEELTEWVAKRLEVASLKAVDPHPRDRNR